MRAVGLKKRREYIEHPLRWGHLCILSLNQCVRLPADRHCRRADACSPRSQSVGCPDCGLSADCADSGDSGDIILDFVAETRTVVLVCRWPLRPDCPSPWRRSTHDVDNGGADA